MENAASRFGQHLAHTEKKYRDRAVKKLTIYLTKKKTWTALEWDKLWKALFYCMWMSDKRPVQEELSTNLAALVHRIPTANMALEFVHSFFRTMHREWHGLDGLRLDKFYSLVRKFIHETIVLLRVQDWQEKLVQEFVMILSTEVVNQLPNGLRLHLADVYLTEVYTAAKDVTTKAFVMLLEPFFSLLTSEYDKTVFKRVRDVVFEDMMRKYQFQLYSDDKKEMNCEKEATDDEEETMVFECVDLAQVQHRIFAIASADDTIECNRAALYTLYKKYFSITHVDSFQFRMEESVKVQEKEEKVEEKTSESEKENETKNVKKSKKRKVKKKVEGEENQVQSTTLKEEKIEDVQTIVKTTTKKIKTQKTCDVETEAVSSEQSKQEKKNDLTEMKSGQKFKRCTSCGGFGKGLVSKDKTLCGHCERDQKSQRKSAILSSKKRKAEALAQSAWEEEEKTEVSKKVTFGKSKALRHTVSVRRLRASAKQDIVAQDNKEIKSVLKTSTQVVAKSPKKKTRRGRMTAADFM
ncbi:putative nucleolar, Nop52 [Plasmopara halstedii]